VTRHLDWPNCCLFHDSHPSPSPTQSSSLASPPSRSQSPHPAQALFDTSPSHNLSAPAFAFGLTDHYPTYRRA
ncbi:hypothetical protein BT69DRAFT_1280851, partial [Atractiella rhizophila]